MLHKEDRKERIQRIQDQDLCHRRTSTTQHNTKILNREDQRGTAQGQVSHRQGSTTKDYTKISQREDLKETAQGQVSYRQGSTTEDKRKIAKREDEKETAQRQVFLRQDSSTGQRKIDVGQRRKTNRQITPRFMEHKVRKKFMRKAIHN